MAFRPANLLRFPERREVPHIATVRLTQGSHERIVRSRVHGYGDGSTQFRADSPRGVTEPESHRG